MTCVVLIPGLLAVLDGMVLLWATLFFASCVLVMALRLKLNAEEKRSHELEALVDFAARRRRTAMDLFHTLGSTFETSVSLENLLRSTVAFFMRIAQATGGIVYMVDRERKHLNPAAMCGTLGGMVGRTRSAIEESFGEIPMGKGIIGEVALSGRPVFIKDSSTDTRLSFLGGEELGIENAMAIPLSFRDHSLGVLVVVNRLSEEGQTGKSFGRFEFQLLEAIALYAATAIYLTLSYLEQAEKQRLDFDLGVASEIQQLLLPQHSPILPDFSIAGHSRPAYRVGGDHYDFIRIDDTKLGVVIADVSGKGVTGALVMAICHTIARTQATNFRGPAEAVRAFRSLLLEDIPEDRFITMIYGILDTAKREFSFTRAGHDPLLCYRAASGLVEVHRPKGGAIGLERGERFDRQLTQQTLALAPHDAIILFTDGITETLNPSGEEFGLDQLTRLISQHGRLSANDLMDVVYEHVEMFAKGAPALDDQTLVIIKGS